MAYRVSRCGDYESVKSESIEYLQMKSDTNMFTRKTEGVNQFEEHENGRITEEAEEENVNALSKGKGKTKGKAKDREREHVPDAEKWDTGPTNAQQKTRSHTRVTYAA